MQRTGQLKDQLQRLQKNRSNIRNICILAHVDHGKTTLADSLVASNGIISQRQAGKLRYLDSREDEQLRGITMKSSAIALRFIHDEQSYLINLIDSPGHVDFSSEVSMAVRLCDGALVVVDAVEGVCPQTQVVLQQAWVEGIKPCLVLNKVDRLITELKYSPTEAYYHLQQILEQVNAVTGSLFTSEVLQSAAQEVTKSDDPMGDQEEVVYDWSSGLEDKDDSTLYFSPEHGNVIFTSALDGWGFGVSHFADMYAKKLGIKAAVLNKTLWGDFYLNSKTKRIFKGAQAKGKKPLFVQFVLDNLWAVYEAVLINKDKARIEKIVSSMNLKISARDSRHTDARIHLFAICSQWLPLANAVLSMVVHHTPSPLQLTRERVEKLMCSSAKTFDSFPLQTQLLCQDFLTCSPDDSAPVILFISKLFAIEKSDLPQHQSRPLTEKELLERRELARLRHTAREAAEENGGNTDQAKEQEDNGKGSVTEGQGSTTEAPHTDQDEEGVVFLAFARVYSGTIRKGAQLFVLHPRYDPREVNLDVMTTIEGCSSTTPLPSHVSRCTVEELYILMGRGVMAVDEVPAGSVLGIAGLEHAILKSATVSDTLACPAFRPMSFAAAPIVRVAVEPMHVTDMPALVSGMKLLNQADPSVEIYVQETGERILSTAGEVHLQKCLNDLKNQYARVKLKVSAPIIPFRETVIVPPKIDMVNEAISAENESLVAKETSHVITITTANKACNLQLEAFPLPTQVTALLEENTNILKNLNLLNGGTAREEIKLNQKTLEALHDLKTNLQSAFNADPPIADFPWEEAVDLIWSFGPRNSSPNLLLNGVEGYERVNVWSAMLESASQPKTTLRDYDNSIISGFQLASLSGPLCEEPLMGVGFILRQWNYAAATLGNGSTSQASQTTTGSTSQTGITTSDITSSSSSQTGLTTVSSSNRTGMTTQTTNDAAESSSALTTDTYGPFSGQLISAMKEGCRKAFLAQPARIMAAMYSCNILATAEVLGRLYGVLGRRNGRVLSDEMKEGSAIFNICAILPVAESFGFAEEVRKKTSGLASPQLIFSHWEVIPNDPFWVPSTEEELLHFGEKADSENVARRYMNTVRKRKGLRVDEKIVEHAEKQRTLKKNK